MSCTSQDTPEKDASVGGADMDSEDLDLDAMAMVSYEL